MRTMPAFRMGRRVYHDEGGRNGRVNTCLGWVAAVLLAVLTFIGIPYFWISTEKTYRNLFEAFGELQSDVVPLQGASNGNVTHFQARNVDANVSDSAFGVALPGALRLSRNTEYCQWQEIATTKTDSQNRTYTQYSYVKTWRSHRIQSLLFDQPAAHHNPQRDPFPSHKFAADVAHADVGQDGSKAIVSEEVIKNTRAPWRRVDWTLGALPRKSWLSDWWPWPDRTRYEKISLLEGAEKSLAAQAERFVYVGQGGYFFSPYTASLSESMLKYFVQYLEGSLLDWQLGDLMPSCTAGDIRVSFSVQDPEEISVVGKVEAAHAQKTWLQKLRLRTSTAPSYLISPYITSKGHEIAMLHAGTKSLKDMMDAEINSQLLVNLLARALLLIPLGVINAGAKLQGCVTIAWWCFCVAGLWSWLWGFEPFAGVFIAVSCAILCYAGFTHRSNQEGAKKV